ncbi:hypothetical protein Q8A67_014135 [Cirrhinus molitorella]|uniref:Uncharacterized protein n=1 Tax=Cirrhinus molitorella TaxID=172907 RepID=A0AA88TJG1_9TELE|nr:hypothetical protein Q8A67_014135 [Cirrhinus molitorella]
MNRESESKTRSCSTKCVKESKRKHVHGSWSSFHVHSCSPYSRQYTPGTSRPPSAPDRLQGPTGRSNTQALIQVKCEPAVFLRSSVVFLNPVFTSTDHSSSCADALGSIQHVCRFLKEADASHASRGGERAGERKDVPSSFSQHPPQRSCSSEREKNSERKKAREWEESECVGMAGEQDCERLCC